MIEVWNGRNDLSHKMGHNNFSDLTDYERKKFLGYVKRPNATKREPVVLDTTDLPAEVNRVTAGAVNPVQDQGQ